MAQLKGDKLGTYLRDLLTSNLQMASIERQVSRIETLVNDFEKDINRSLDQFTQANSLNENLLGDLGEIYMFQIGILMKLQMEKYEIRGMQAKGKSHAKASYLKGKNHE